MLPTLLLVDGHSLAFRSYYAFAYKGEGGLRTSTGVPTSICFGFLKALLEILQKEKPTAVAIAFDLATPTFRHEADENYKSGRKETPEDFIPDLANLQRILAAMNLRAISVAGYEADDVLGTLSLMGTEAGYAVKILSGDQDLFQLINDEKQISVLHIGQKDKIIEFHAAHVQEKLSITPAQVIDYKALCGDQSDKIPGVRGIGEKTAVKLLAEYGNLSQIFAAVSTMKGSIKQKLEQGLADAQHSYFMAKIIQDVPLPTSLEECKLIGFDTTVLIPLLQELELKAYINKVDAIQTQLGGTIAVEDDDDIWFDFVDEPEVPQNSISLAVQIIDTPEKLVALTQKLLTLDTAIAWDTETTALNPHDATLVGVGCCWGSDLDQVAYIAIAHTKGQNLDLGLVVAHLKPLLESRDRPKIFQNTKFDRLMFKAVGIELQGVVFDTMIASYVIDPEMSHSLSELSKSLLKITAKSYKDLVGKQDSIAAIAIPEVAQYCGMDAYSTFLLRPILQSKLEAVPDLLKLFYEVELPLELVLAEMEWLGIRIDREYLGQFSQELEIDLDAIAQRAYAEVGREFNLNSPKQLS